MRHSPAFATMLRARMSICAALAIAGISAIPDVAPAASLLAPPPLPESAFADAEAATNLVFDAGTARDNKWRLPIELDAKSNLARVVRHGAIPANERIESRVTRNTLAILVR